MHRKFLPCVHQTDELTIMRATCCNLAVRVSVSVCVYISLPACKTVDLFAIFCDSGRASSLFDTFERKSVTSRMEQVRWLAWTLLYFDD